MLATSRCAADTMPQSTPLIWRRNFRPYCPSSSSPKEKNMKRTWDESTSPQWRYLLSKESEKRRTAKWTAKNQEEEEEKGEIKRNKPGKKAKQQKKKQQQEENIIIPKDKQFTKKGKEIVYSASPGPERYFHKNPKQQQPKQPLKNELFTTTDAPNP